MKRLKFAEKHFIRKLYIEKMLICREQQRRLLDSRVPPDVQTLMAQKRELTHQLDREQNEKHELFMQVSLNDQNAIMKNSMTE